MEHSTSRPLVYGVDVINVEMKIKKNVNKHLKKRGKNLKKKTFVNVG